MQKSPILQLLDPSKDDHPESNAHLVECLKQDLETQ